jgi:ribonuclease HI
MAKGGSESAAEGLEDREVAGEHRRAVADAGDGGGAGTGDPDEAAPMGNRRSRPSDRVEAGMRVYIWCDGAAIPNGGPAGAGYVVAGGVHLLGSEPLGKATNNVAEYAAVRNALRAAADAGATSAHVRMDSRVVYGQLAGITQAWAEHLIELREEVKAEVARYPGRVTFARIPRERNGVADQLAKDGARASKALLGEAIEEMDEPVVEASPKPKKAKNAPEWKSLPDDRKAAYLLEHITLSDRTWTDEPRLKGEKRDAFIRRILLR